MPRFALLCALSALLFSVAANAATLREQRTSLRRASTALRAAVRLAKAERPDDAKEQFEKARKEIESVGKGLDEKLKRTFERVGKDLLAAHAALSKRGVKLDALGELSPTMAAGGGKGRFDRSQVSFTKQVAPLLVEKCGRCHVDASRGGFSLSTYNSLMKGTRNGGRVLVPGEGTGGVMMDLIESGDMPRGGITMTPQQATLLSRWITQGAKFDGDKPDTNLKNLKPGNSPPTAPTPEPPKPQALLRATGEETVSFALDIAPILADRCNNCHVLNNRGNLRFANFRQLLRSGIVASGKPDTSSLVRRLRGDDTPRMPMNAAPLSEAQIAKFVTWVREGARFDGDQATDSLDRTTAVVRAGRATAVELDAMRKEQTRLNWQLALSDETMRDAQTDHFLVVGALATSRLEETGLAAERARASAVKLFGESQSKGRLTLYVFDQRINYSEFATMVERRQLPRGTDGHARHDPVDPYACMKFDAASDELDEFVVAQQVATLYVAELTKGKAPAWFTTGAGSVAAAKAFPRDPRVEAQQDSLDAYARGTGGADDFLTGRMPPERAAAVAHHFVDAMMRSKRGFTKLLKAVGQDDSFLQAFSKQYNASPGELAEKWQASLKRKR